MNDMKNNESSKLVIKSQFFYFANLTIFRHIKH